MPNITPQTQLDPSPELDTSRGYSIVIPENGNLIHATLLTQHRAVLDAYFSTIKNLYSHWDTNRPLLVLWKVPDEPPPPYTRAHVIGMMKEGQSRPMLRVYVAMLVKHSLYGRLLQFFTQAMSALLKNAQGRVFTSETDAIAWLESQNTEQS
jgi:hypothetical protein